jgi:Conjugative transposon protein TcpC
MPGSSALSADRRQTIEGPARSPAVAITTTPLWRLRLARDLARYLLYATCAWGLLASARFAIAPPRPLAAAFTAPAGPPPDLAARGYAVLFARRYLTWDAAAPQQSEGALGSMMGTAIAPDAGLTLPANGAQRVLWAEAVQERTPAPGRHVYTVAAQTDTSGLQYVTVAVVRGADGRLAVSGYPAFVGAPLTQPAGSVATGGEVRDPALTAVVERALRNYLAAAPQELAADLTPGARVALPATPQTLESMQSLAWSPDRRSVLAVVQARDSRGARYTLGYEADVVQPHGRWEISAIETDPTE